MVAVRDTAQLHSEVASFASSLGFSSAAGVSSSGFNDSDFRKVGPIKPNSRLASAPQKGRKFDDKHRKRNDGGNRKRILSSTREPDRSVSVAEVENTRFKNLPKLPLVKHSSLGLWHRDAADLEEKVIGKNKNIEFSSVEEWKAFVEKKRELGQRLLVQYVQDYWSSRGQHNDIKMLVASQRTGTAADKVSALSVLIGDNAVANLKSIDSLSGMVISKIGKRHAFTAFVALKEIFIILLPDRKLKALYQRPLNHLPENKEGYSLLLFWYWEECLKDRYERFVSALEGASLDVVVELKNLALKTIYTLLRSKSEQERRLLLLLVNKLGDPENKVASNADYHLTHLLSEHPNMKAVVIDEVDNFLFRPHLGLRAKYHAVNFLSQIRLSHKGDGPNAAKRLIDIYFALFKVLVSEAAPSAEKNDKKGPNTWKDDQLKAKSGLHVQMDSRLLSAVLTGVNRAFPYLHDDEADDVVQVQTPLLFQMVHSKNFNVGVQSLMLLDKISSKNQIASDRFYRALYSKLVLPSAMISSKEEMLIALILRAMKNDVNLKRVAAFSKRLLQVALQLPPQYACGFLFLLSEVLKARPPLWNMMLQNGVAAADEDLEHFEDIVDNDDKLASPSTDTKENKAHDASHMPDDDVASTSNEISSGNSGSASYDINEEDNLFGEDGLGNLDEVNSGPDKEQTLPAQISTSGYNPGHREPSYCNADRVGWWELTVLAAHVHPSVAAMARTLLSGVNIMYNGNPLTDLSLVAFLDKFMEKKPKRSVWHGASQIEPAKKLEMNHGLIGAEILSLAEGDVPPEDVAFHKFYMNKMNSSKKAKKKKKKKKSTVEDEAEEELYAVDGDEEDESENEETEEFLEDSAKEGDYDYDELDKIGEDEDEDLIDDGSEEEVEDGSEEEEESGDDVDVDVGEADDRSEDEEKESRRKKLKSSPFASLDEYQHLMETENDEKRKKSISSSHKRRRKSSNRKV